MSGMNTKSSFAAVTIIARNYLPFARVLAKSLLIPLTPAALDLLCLHLLSFSSDSFDALPPFASFGAPHGLLSLAIPLFALI